MNTFIMILATVLSFGVVIVMLLKKMDIKIALFLMGIVLMFVAMAMGNGISGLEAGALPILDPFIAIVNQFKSTLTAAGFIILILGGYSTYMSAIGANDVTVAVLTKPIARIKSPYILVPVVFLLGNLLSLVVPSASNLAIILLATLYPILVKAGMSRLTAAAVIATTATVMPTPLGGDNVAIAVELANYTEFAGITPTEYVFRYHAIVSIPTLLIMALVHYFWQKRMDKKTITSLDGNFHEEETPVIEGGTLFKIVYAILPVFPLLLLIAVFVLQTAGLKVNIGVELAVILSFVLAIICEIIRKKSGSVALKETESFFKGMGGGMPTVALLVAATVFVTGLKSIGLISSLQTAMQNVQGSTGFLLPLILVGFTALIVMLSGSGTALFYAMVPLMVPLAVAASINPIAVTVPMGLAGNLLRAASPVSAVVMIVAGSTKETPMDIVKRTSVPMVAGTVFMFILSMIVFL